MKLISWSSSVSIFYKIFVLLNFRDYQRIKTKKKGRPVDIVMYNTNTIYIRDDALLIKNPIVAKDGLYVFKFLENKNLLCICPLHVLDDGDVVDVFEELESAGIFRVIDEEAHTVQVRAELFYLKTKQWELGIVRGSQIENFLDAYSDAEKLHSL